MSYRGKTGRRTSYPGRRTSYSASKRRWAECHQNTHQPWTAEVGLTSDPIDLVRTRVDPDGMSRGYVAGRKQVIEKRQRRTGDIGQRHGSTGTSALGAA